MKLLSVEQARAAWLFPLMDMNPLGKYLLPITIALSTRYKFANNPNVVEALKKKEGLIFGNGVFAHPKLGELTLDIAIYNDAVFADTRADTEASDAFMEDLLMWLANEYGLKYPENPRRQHISRVFVQSKKRLNSLNPRLEKFARALSARSEGFGSVAYELGGVNFTAQQAGPLVPHVFRFERAENIPYSENRYFSYAALPTKEHLALLDELEEILS